MSQVSKEFVLAQKSLSKLKNEPGNDAKLKLYALYKQATVGVCNTNKPGMLDIVGRAKWDAWRNLKQMSKNEAELNYIRFVNELLKAENQELVSLQSEMNQNSLKQKETEGSSKFKDIKTSILFDNVYMICLNRPKMYNAFSREMFEEVVSALKEADSNPDVLLVCMTGSGDYFSSGNDLNNFSKIASTGDDVDLMKLGCDIVENFLNAFINFSKPLVAFVNGPAIGIAFTVLGVFDFIVASDKAYFHAPFTQISLSPEGCSSYTFPRIMGQMRAAEVLLFNKKLTAQEAFNYGFVNEIVPKEKFETKTMEKLKYFSQIPRNSLIESKNFLRKFNREDLINANKQEMELLYRRFQTGEFLESVAAKMNKKSKL